MRSFILVLGVLVWMAAGLRPAAPGEPLAFTPAERDRVLALGPWPVPWRPDPTNRVSGHADAVALGRLLFFDARLSGQGTHSCSSCHRPEMAWSDGRPTALGLSRSRRNTPGLLDVRLRRWFGWDGAADSLWMQSIRPILDVGEMGASAEHVRAHIVANVALSELYAVIFGRPATVTGAQDVLVDAAKALAAYQETIVGPATPFDAFRDALVADIGAAPYPVAPYPVAARRGLKLFVGAAGCVGCHGGPTFSRDATSGAEGFHRIAASGRPGRGTEDRGRWAGLEGLPNSPYGLPGRFNDQTPSARPTHEIASTAPDRRRFLGAFRTPSLRQVTRTGPYMHDGRVATLARAVAHAVGSGAGGSAKLRRHEIADLVAFLRTLSSP